MTSKSRYTQYFLIIPNMDNIDHLVYFLRSLRRKNPMKKTRIRRRRKMRKISLQMTAMVIRRRTRKTNPQMMGTLSPRNRTSPPKITRMTQRKTKKISPPMTATPSQPKRTTQRTK